MYNTTTDRLDVRCYGFSKISHFLERVPMEHIETKNSSDSKLQIGTICSISNHSRNRDNFEKQKRTDHNGLNIRNSVDIIGIDDSHSFILCQCFIRLSLDQIKSKISPDYTEQSN